jgi:hypothetical protein
MNHVRVIFDEAHCEAWTIRPEVARVMQPAHPGDASYARAAAVLCDRGFAVHANVDAALTAPALTGCDLLVIAHPSEAKWERTTAVGSPRLSAEEIDAIEAFVRGGGGLVVLGETEQEKYGNNVNELLARFGLELANDTVQDYEHCAGAPTWILGELEPDDAGAARYGEAGCRAGRKPVGGRGRDGDLLARVTAACFYRATTIASSNGARVIARTHGSASVPGAPLIVAGEYGNGRVVVLADSDLFGDDCIEELDHAALWLNIAAWSSRRNRAGQPAGGYLDGQPPGWPALKDATNAVALLQAPDGSLADGADADAAAAGVDAIQAALSELAASVPDQAAFLELCAQDLRAWRDGGYGKPDFTRSLQAFRPELARVDGRRHIVFFPMYKQNGSRDTCFEALIVRVPWPAWIADLERTRYDNAKFVPVELVDATSGYDSDCAVLFPEMVSVAQRPVNNFGAIFCDRESARLRRVAGEAADLLRLNVPPDAARLLASPEISQQAYILWDLIHDRAHSHGDLPFDPFMIRQRAPYWMYSLEELRCDLTAYAQAVELERTHPFARNVQYAILLDRLLRFPITGERVRNYDGLGGQLLFSYLHRHDYLRWTDNRLTIDWERVSEGVAGLRDEIHELYRSGIDRTKLQHWAAAHDLVAQSVAPAAGSKWAAAVRELPEVEDPRPYCDLVLPDEFPLSIFYSSLKAKWRVS